MGFNKDSKYFYGAFLFFGLSLLTRYNALLIIPFIILYALYLFFVDRKKIISAVKNKNAYLSPLVFVAAIIPWAIHEKIHFGDVFYGMKLASMQLPTYNIASFSWYQYLLYLPGILGMSIFILSLFGLYYILVKKDKMGLFLLLNSVIVLAWFSHYSYKEPRLIIQIVPILAVFAGIGLSKVIYPSVKCQLKSKNIALIATVVILIISFYSSYNSVTPYINQVTAAGYPSLIDATGYAKVNSKATEKLIGASGPQYYWYSNRKIVGFAPNKSEFSNVQLKDTSIKYILINNHERNQPRYILDFFIDTFFNKTTGQLKHNEDTSNVKIFGDLMHFNDPMNYPTTIVVSRELFDLRNNEQD